MSFSTLPVAIPGPEYPTQPTHPAAGSTGNIALTRKRAVGNASYQIDAAKVCALPALPVGAQSCIMMVEAANNTIPGGQVLLRFWMDGQWPTVISGLPTYDGQAYEIIGLDDMNNFRVISTDGNQHVMQFQFFSNL